MRKAFILLLLWSWATLLRSQDHALVYSLSDTTAIPVNCVTSLSNGGVLTCGLNYADTSFCTMELSISGEVVGCFRSIWPAMNTGMYPQVIRELHDGDHLVLAARTPTNNTALRDFLLFRHAMNGTPLWARRYSFTDLSLGAIVGSAMEPLANGDVLVYLRFPDAFVLVRLTGAGIPIWSKAYGVNDLTYQSGVDQPAAHIDDHGVLVVSPIYQQPATYRVGTAYLDTTGALQWSRSYCFGESPKVDAVAKLSDGSFILGGRAYDLGPQHPMSLKIGPEGDVVWRRNFWDPNHLLGYVTQVVGLPDDEFLLFSGGPARDHIIRCSSTGEAVSDNRNDGDSSAFTGGWIVQADEQGFRLTGSAHYGVFGWGFWGRALDMTFGIDSGGDCSRTFTNVLSEEAVVDSMAELIVNSAPTELTHEDMTVASTSLIVEVQDLCEFANAINAMASSPTDQLSVIPTPNDGNFTLQLPFQSGWQGAIVASVLDVHGRHVFNTRFSSGQVSLSFELPEMNPGVYQILLINGTEILHGRTVVE